MEPAEQGTGIGGNLLRAAGEIADGDGLPIVLLAFNPRNMLYYQNHGYDVICSDESPNSGTPWWGMKRVG